MPAVPMCLKIRPLTVERIRQARLPVRPPLHYRRLNLVHTGRRQPAR